MTRQTDATAPLKISNASIEPTRSCFDDALDFFEQVVDLARMTRDDLASTYRVVHGICVGADIAQRYAHAWVEEIGVELEYTLQDGSSSGYKQTLLGEIVWQAGVVDGARVYFAVERQWFY